MTLVEKAKRLDREIAEAGGLAAHWTREQERRERAGLPAYRRLIDPETGRVVADRDDTEGR